METKIERIKFKTNWFYFIIGLIIITLSFITLLTSDNIVSKILSLLSLLFGFSAWHNDDIWSIKKYLNDERRELLNGIKRKTRKD